jgi:protein-disulfide isomerase
MRVSIVMILIAAAVGCSRPPNTTERIAVSAEEAARVVAEAGGVSAGSRDATVVVYEFADFQCPACAMTAAEILPGLKKSYDPVTVNFVRVDFPLGRHKNAVPAALAARCAGDHGQYAEYHDMLYRKQSEWSGLEDPVGRFVAYARTLDLDGEELGRCIKEAHHSAAIRAGEAAANALGLSSTPSFVINGQLVRRGDLKAAIDAAVSGVR